MTVIVRQLFYLLNDKHTIIQEGSNGHGKVANGFNLKGIELTTYSTETQDVDHLTATTDLVRNNLIKYHESKNSLVAFPVETDFLIGIE